MITIDATEAVARVYGPGEIALIDLREAGPFSEGHPLFAVPCAYSRLELRIGALVPRWSAPIILVDGGDGIARRAGQQLEAMGYGDVSVVEGGVAAFAETGETLYKGVNVPSKVLGELAEAEWNPRRIDAGTLARWQEEGRAFALFDCRPPDEFTKMTVPGARCVPNGEVAHRLPEIDGPLVLTCAGRTRGLTGALGLSLVAPECEVHALENGTQGWALAGLALSRGNDPQAMPSLGSEGRQATRERAERFFAKHRIPVAQAPEIADFLGQEDRTTYLFDVRSAAEAEADPLPAFRHAWSGQLVQATDRWVGVRRARIVLADDLGLRAGLAAFWLRMLGFDPHVALVEDRMRDLVAPERPGPTNITLPERGPKETLAGLAARHLRLIDLRSSDKFRRGHVVGAEWSIRPDIEAFRDSRHSVLFADDQAVARLAAWDLRGLGVAKVELAAGGFEALRRAGADIAESPDEPPPLRAPDVTWFAHGRHDGDLEASRLYLAWETDLVAQLSVAERAEFGP